MPIEIKENALQEKVNLDEILQTKVKERRYLSAIKLAQTFKLGPEIIRDLQKKAIKQMAFEYRNAAAVRSLAREWDITKAELEGLLKTCLEEYEEISSKKRSEQAYDVATGKYLTPRQWVEQFLKT